MNAQSSETQSFSETASERAVNTCTGKIARAQKQYGDTCNGDAQKHA